MNYDLENIRLKRAAEGSNGKNAGVEGMPDQSEYDDEDSDSEQIKMDLEDGDDELLVLEDGGN